MLLTKALLGHNNLRRLARHVQFYDTWQTTLRWLEQVYFAGGGGSVSYTVREQTKNLVLVAESEGLFDESGAHLAGAELRALTLAIVEGFCPELGALLDAGAKGERASSGAADVAGGEPLPDADGKQRGLADAGAATAPPPSAAMPPAPAVAAPTESPASERQ